MISREHAAEIARSDALAHGLGNVVFDVLSADEISGRAPMLYDINLDGCWIAYIEPPGPPGLRSSTIIAVDRIDGNIIYRGSANDEG